MIRIQDGYAPWLFLLLLETLFVTEVVVERSSKTVKRNDGTGSRVSAELALSLRRQLMNNNYDYMSSSSEGTEVPGPDLHRPPPPQHSAELAPRINEVYIARVHTLQPNTFNTPESRAPSKKDLLYYMDDRLLVRRVGAGDDVVFDAEEKEGKEGKEGKDFPVKGQPETTSDGIAEAAKDKVAEGEEDIVEDSTGTSSTAKYKLLKVKTHILSRRSGRPVYRRLLQEEGAAGVALINLSDGPFPDFRLPSPHRQRDSDELRPPSVPPEDLKTITPSDQEEVRAH